MVAESDPGNPAGCARGGRLPLRIVGNMSAQAHEQESVARTWVDALRTVHLSIRQQWRGGACARGTPPLPPGRVHRCVQEQARSSGKRRITVRNVMKAVETGQSSYVTIVFPPVASAELLNLLKPSSLQNGHVYLHFYSPINFTNFLFFLICVLFPWLYLH